MFKEIRIHIGVLAVLIGTAFLLVRFARVSTSLLIAVAPTFIIYLGVFWIVSAICSRRSNGRDGGKGT
jgi:uncharacterized membrane protein YhaH (DUF805 family)